MSEVPNAGQMQNGEGHKSQPLPVQPTPPAMMPDPQSLSLQDKEGPVSQYDGEKPDKVDFTNYFVTYGYIYHQKEMIEDHIRTGKYFEAIMGNREQFKDRTVLDLGAGSGVLSIFAAKAGARKVYAVEATDVAKMAKRLVEHNKVGHIVEVIQGVSESITIPEKVDIIVSEWMGYFLLRESMLDSVLDARDRFLKPGGALYPSHASLMLMPLNTPLMDKKATDFEKMIESEVSLPLMGTDERVNALCGYFDVEFRGSEANPASIPISLSTAPTKEGWWSTHWGQQIMLLARDHSDLGFYYTKGDMLKVAIKVERNREFKRHLTITVDALIDGGFYAKQEPKKLKFELS